MLAPERQSRILKELANHEAVRVVDLAGALNVSEMTVRRDIEALDGAGLARKIHGGATRASRLSAVEPGFSLNADLERDAKIAIARLALTLVEPGMTIALTGGTTTWQLATMLGTVENLTVVTNSLKVAQTLYPQEGPHSATVILTGGERTPSEALVGPVALMSIDRLNTDICFMGAHGIDAVRGLTSPNLLEAQTNAGFIAAANRLVVLADHTKFNVRSLALVAGLDAVTELITDDGAGPDTRDTFSPLVKSFTTAAPTVAASDERRD